MNPTSDFSRKASIYQIKIQGHLKDKRAQWLNGMVLKIENNFDGADDTHIQVCVPDQAALRGILNKLWDLNLTLISVTRKDNEQ
ncbi:MAG: hypothetical protein MUO62_02840 [Anaerolineales bacterium]|nr:hypothetical protein [Anaerolineales bacterium]